MTILATYDTTTLQGIIANGDKFTPYLSSIFCPRSIFFETEKIAFDEMFEELSLSPYVSPLVAGKVNVKSGSTTKEFKVPYIKDKDQVTPADGVKRAFGEGFTGTMSPDQRIAAERVRLLNRHGKRLDMRIEEQVSQLINRGGKILCEGEGFPASEVDYGMTAANNITLAGAAKWDALLAASDSGQSILDDIETYAELASEAVTMITMDKTAWKTFAAFPAVKDLLDTTYRGDEATSLTRAPSNGEHVQYKGTLGVMRIFVYTGFYRDADSNKVPFLDTGRVVLHGANPQGVVAFGAIKDMQQLRAVKRFAKNWFSEDPSAENIMSQSAPLAALPDIDSIVTVKVL